MDDNDDESENGAVSHHTPQQRGKKKGLSQVILRQLLRDIEEKGGIQLISAKSICDHKPDIYGATRSELRGQVLNKVSKWKLLTPAKYHQVVQRISSGVAFGSDDDRRILPFHGSPIPEEQADPYATHLYLRSPQQVFTSPPEAPIEMAHSSSIIPASKDSAYTHGVLTSTDYVEIQVDIERPEKNGEAQVFHFMGKNHNGKLHNGFSIELNVDIRDVKNEQYHAFLLPDKHRVLIKMPAQCATFTLDHTVVAQKEKDKCEKVTEARNVSRHAIQDSPDRLWKNVILSFPAYMELSNLIYSPNTSDGRIQMAFVPYTATVTLSNKPYSALFCRVMWKLHLVEAAQRIVEKQGLASNYEDELAKALDEGLGTSSLFLDGTHSSALIISSTRRNQANALTFNNHHPREENAYADDLLMDDEGGHLKRSHQDSANDDSENLLDSLVATRDDDAGNVLHFFTTRTQANTTVDSPLICFVESPTRVNVSTADDALMDDEGGHLKRSHPDSATSLLDVAAVAQDKAAGHLNKWFCLASSSEENSIEGDSKLHSYEDAAKTVHNTSVATDDDNGARTVLHFSATRPQANTTDNSPPFCLATPTEEMNVMTANDTLMDDEGGHLKRSHHDFLVVDNGPSGILNHAAAHSHMKKWVRFASSSSSDEESIDV